jgi:amino acid permease
LELHLKKMGGGNGMGPGAHRVNESTPLLVNDGAGKASTLKTYGNIFISIVGAGVLGLPYTYKTSGYAVAVTCVICSAFLSYYCMMKLVSLSSSSSVCSRNIFSVAHAIV